MNISIKDNGVGISKISGHESCVLRVLKAMFLSGYKVLITTDCQKALQILCFEQVYAILKKQLFKRPSRLSSIVELSPGPENKLLSHYQN